MFASHIKDKVYQGLERLLSPPQCLHCDHRVPHPKMVFCLECASHIYPVEGKLCDRCGLPLRDLPVSTDRDLGGLCTDCDRNAPMFTSARAPFLYDGTLSATIQRIKYGKREADLRRLHQWIIPTLHDHLNTLTLATGPLTIMPVPPTRRATRQRGFHIPSVLAHDYGRWIKHHPNTQLEVSVSTLRRLGKTRAQAGLTLHERRLNVVGDFYCKGSAPAHVCIIDDVMTTGATVNEAARALKEAGSVEVHVLALCRRLFTI